MEFFSVFVRRRIFALMLNLAVVVIGLICYLMLGVDLYPKINFPIVTIAVQMPGAPPEVMEQQVARVVEDAVSVLGGLDNTSSQSSTGYCGVTVQFQMSKNINLAVQEVRDKVNAELNNLPAEIMTPVIDKVDTAAIPVISVVLSGLDGRALTRLANDKIKDSLQSVDGVGQVNMIGAQTRQINLELDYKKMQAFGVSVSDVKNAVSQQNKEVGGGTLRSPLFDLNMRTMGLLTSAAQFDDVIVKIVNGTPLTFHNVGRAVDGTEDVTSISRYNDEPALTLQILKTGDANTVTVVNTVKSRVAEMQKTLPPGVKMILAADQSVIITESVQDILQHLILGSLLASLMVLLFLGDVRSTIIATVAIPCSIIGGFIVMVIFGYTLNQITLLAMALVVGIVIDDAVVVLEEIHRLMDTENLTPREAAEKGIQTIGFAVMATTLSLVVIFLPIAFMPGILGAWFSSYGVLMAATIMISMFVSFTLTPMMCSVLLREKNAVEKETWVDRLPKFLRLPMGAIIWVLKIPLRILGALLAVAVRAFAIFYTYLVERPYIGLLRFTLHYRLLVIFLCLGITAWGVYLYQRMGQDFTQAQDENTVSITLRLPPSRSIYANDDAMRGIMAELRRDIPQTDYTLSTIGGDTASGSESNVGSITIQLKPFEERAHHKPLYTVFEAQATCRRILSHYPEIRSSVTVGDSGGAGFSCVISGPDLALLSKAATTLVDTLKNKPGFVDIDSNLSVSAPELQVYVERERAAHLGVNFLDAASTVQSLIGGVKVSSFYEGKDRFDVKLRLRPSQRERANVIENLTVPNSKGVLIPMSNVVRVKEGLAATTIRHYNRQRQVTVSANLVDFPLLTAMDFGKKTVKDMKLGGAYTVDWQGNGQYMQSILLVFAVTFMVSVVFMFMVLASQFESLTDPLIILATLPLCLPFAFLSLSVTHNTLNIFSILGLFLLVGVVKKNAIFQIDTTREMLAAERPLYESIIEANRIRLRPIIMTTVTLVVAMLPVAMAGANGWTRAPMAIVIVGGQTLSLVLTLIVVPALYSFVHDFSGRKYRSEVLKR